jgi:hypothetical protein
LGNLCTSQFKPPPLHGLGIGIGIGSEDMVEVQRRRLGIKTV